MSLEVLSFPGLMFGALAGRKKLRATLVELPCAQTTLQSVFFSLGVSLLLSSSCAVQVPIVPCVVCGFSALSRASLARSHILYVQSMCTVEQTTSQL